MHECYAMQILKAQKKTKQYEKNGHKEYWDETQGLCQKDSIRLSLLHPKLLDATLEFELLFILKW